MYLLGDEPSSDTAFPEINELFINDRKLGDDEHPFPVPRVERFWSMLIEPPIYLNAILHDYLLAGGKVVIRDFQNIAAVLALNEPAVVTVRGWVRGSCSMMRN